MFCLFMALYSNIATVLSMTNKDVMEGSWNNSICGFYFDSIVSELPLFSWRLTSIGSVYDLGPCRRQTITWINGNPVHICICASPALNTSNCFFANECIFNYFWRKIIPMLVKTKEWISVSLQNVAKSIWGEKQGIKSHSLLGHL